MLDLSRQTFRNVDYSGQDLTGVSMHHSTFSCCNFNDAILNEADCSHSKFSGSTMVGTKCRNTNFANASLNCIFKPDDAYGMIISLKCSTFRGMITSALWFYCLQQFSLLMVVEKEADGTDPQASLIASLGVAKYLALKRTFREREL